MTEDLKDFVNLFILFNSLVKGGFTEDQALSMIVKLMVAQSGKSLGL